MYGAFLMSEITLRANMNSPTQTKQKRPYVKQAISITEQIKHLKSRGLAFDDEVRAERYLKHIGYYRLSAYFKSFQGKSGSSHSYKSKFKSNVKFENILSLYIFDRKLRLLILEAIERIEVVARAQWSHELSMSYKSPLINMSDTSIFQFDPIKETPGDTVHKQELSKIRKDISFKTDEFIAHHKENYTINEDVLLPIWVLTEVISFGSLSKWIKATKNKDIKNKLCDTFCLSHNNKHLESIFHALTTIRNICAHHARLWDQNFARRRLPYLRNHLNMEPDSRNSGAKIQPSALLFNYLLVLAHFVRCINPNSTWQERLCALLVKESTEAQRKSMGFPVDWEEKIKRSGIQVK